MEISSSVASYRSIFLRLMHGLDLSGRNRKETGPKTPRHLHLTADDPVPFIIHPPWPSLTVGFVVDSDLSFGLYVYPRNEVVNSKSDFMRRRILGGGE